MNFFPSLIKCLQIKRGIRKFFCCVAKDSPDHDAENHTLIVGREFRCHCHSVLSKRCANPFYVNNSDCWGS